MRDRHQGETCVVIANGPSLLDVSKSFLDQHITIGCNHMGCACPDTYYKPTYYSNIGLNHLNARVRREHYYQAVEGARDAFLNLQAIHKFPQDNIHGIASRGALGFPMPSPHGKFTFSKDIFECVGIGFTQTYVNFQIAYYLGFDTVLVVGLDNDYRADKDKRHYYDDKSDPVHHPRSSYTPEKFTAGSNYVFDLANQAFVEDGRRIINLTQNSKALLPEGKLSDWMEYANSR